MSMMRRQQLIRMCVGVRDAFRLNGNDDENMCAYVYTRPEDEEGEGRGHGSKKKNRSALVCKI